MNHGPFGTLNKALATSFSGKSSGSSGTQKENMKSLKADVLGAI
jgi:hypothetical protein